MPFSEYIELVKSISLHRSRSSGRTVPRKLRPVQKDAIRRAKELENSQK